MTSMSSYLKVALIRSTLRGYPFASPAQFYIALFITDPTAEGTGQEVSGGSYERKSVLFEEISVGAVRNKEDVIFPTPTSEWGKVRWLAVYDSDMGGNMLYYGRLKEARLIDVGSDPFKVRAGNLIISF